MKKVLTVMAVLAIALIALPAFATIGGDSWVYTYSEGFESMRASTSGAQNWYSISGADNASFGWKKNQNGATSVTNLDGRVYDDPANARTGEHYFQNPYQSGNSQGSSVYKDMRYLNSKNMGYGQGWYEYYFYDPVGISTSTTGTMLGLQLMGANFSTSSTASAYSYGFGVIVGDSRAGASPQTTTGKQYYVAAHGGTFTMMDGSGASANAGSGTAGSYVWKSVAGQARQRTQGWHQVNVVWDFTLNNSTAGELDFYVDDMVVPAAIVTLDSRNSRWANMKNPWAWWMGASGGGLGTPGRIDDISFYGNAVVPEPSSLLAVGTGMIGLLGLIRRRK